MFRKKWLVWRISREFSANIQQKCHQNVPQIVPKGVTKCSPYIPSFWTFPKLSENVRWTRSQFVIPTGLYSDRSIFRQVDIPTGLYSDRSTFRQVIEVVRNSLFILYRHSDFTSTKRTRDRRYYYNLYYYFITKFVMLRFLKHNNPIETHVDYMCLSAYS